VILDPADGADVADVAIVISGLARPGATVTRVVPLWFDEHVVADSRGRWSFPVVLAPGENVFTFRVDGDVATEVSLTVYFDPT
jgi:hypothetical protein